MARIKIQQGVKNNYAELLLLMIEFIASCSGDLNK